MSMTLVQTITLSTTATSITFSSIPQTGKDLYVTLCYDGDSQGSYELDLQINGTTNTIRRLQAANAGASSQSGDQISVMDSDYPQTDGFHALTVRVPNYTKASARPFSTDAVVVSNNTQTFAACLTFTNGISSSTAAVTSLAFVSGYLNFRANTTASLYIVS